MKKLFAIALVSVLSLVSVNAYASDTFAKGDWLGSATIGFGYGFAQRIAVDYGVLDGMIDGNASLGVGASVNNTIGWHGGDVASLILNCSFHYQFVENLDTYVVVGFGGGIGGAHGSVHGYFDWTSSLGARYYFDPSWAVNAEVGHTNSSFFNVGVTYKF